MRYRITLRRSDDRPNGPDTVELRGYMDDTDNMVALADALQPLGILVVASPAEDDYDPFMALPPRPSWPMRDREKD